MRIISGPPLGCRVCDWSRCWLLAGRTHAETWVGLDQGFRVPDNRGQAAAGAMDGMAGTCHRVTSALA